MALGEAPEEWELDYDAKQPEDWDTDDDGPWERPMRRKDPPTTFAIFLQELRGNVLSSCPWLLLGLLTTGILQAFKPSQGTIDRHLTGHNVLGVTAKGAVMGLLSPLCSCGCLPVACGLAAAGAMPSAIVAFVVAAQSAGVDSVLFTLGVLGPRVAAARMVTATLLAMVAGAAAPRQVDRREASKHRDSHVPVGRRLSAGLCEAVTTLFDELAPALLFGFSATAAVVALLPSGGLARVALLGGLPGRCLLFLLALPLQFCEHAAVPLSAALQRAGASGGLGFAVLATLPSVNTASLGIIASFAGPFGAARVAAAVWLSGVLGSYAAEQLGADVEMNGHVDQLVPEWFAASSPYMVGAIAVGAVVRNLPSYLKSGRQANCDSACGKKTD